MQPTQLTATANPIRKPIRKATAEELNLMRSLKRLLAHRTSPDALRGFLQLLNSAVVTALIQQALDRLEPVKTSDGV